MTTPLCLQRAVVTRHDDGSVRFDDADCPVIVTVMVDTTSGLPRLVSVRVDARPGSVVSSKLLARLPMSQMRHLAALRQPPSHPDEAHWRSMVLPKLAGHRDWPEDHWRIVWLVYRWAVETARPGGGYRAVADVWGVTTNPTAYRWVARARQRYQRDQDGEE